MTTKVYHAKMKYVSKEDANFNCETPNKKLFYTDKEAMEDMLKVLASFLETTYGEEIFQEFSNVKNGGNGEDDTWGHVVNDMKETLMTKEGMDEFLATFRDDYNALHFELQEFEL
jgi:hypothetical protein